MTNAEARTTKHDESRMTKERRYILAQRVSESRKFGIRHSCFLHSSLSVWRLTSDDERQSKPLLILILAFLVRVAFLANLVRFEEQNLRDPFVGIHLGRQRRGVADLDRDLAAPLRL